MKTIRLKVSEIEIDQNRGVIYVHGANGITTMRIKTLGTLYVHKHRPGGGMSNTDFVTKEDIIFFVEESDIVNEDKGTAGNVPEELDRAKRAKPSRKRTRAKEKKD
jgi:nucleosome binding factor SPN SPT16 subunit